jgi:hypothetical protein
LPNVPVNALVIDKDSPDTYYIATDVAVFRTTNAGASWTQFSQGLPNCAVFDLKLHSKSRLLRAATHGRGLWERKLDAVAMSDVDLYVRDNVMDTGRGGPTPSSVKAAFEDPTRGVTLGATLNPRMCADIKVDALEGPSPAYQMNVAEVDYAAFEARLYHRNPRRGQVNRVYVQINNRGIKPASQVSVKLLYAKSAESLPALPADFWSAFPNDSAHTSVWKPIGAAKLVPTVSHLEPLILSWDWSTPEDAPERSCLLVVVDCAADPIPPGNRIRNVQKLSREDKRVGLLKVRVV